MKKYLIALALFFTSSFAYSASIDGGKCKGLTEMTMSSCIDHVAERNKTKFPQHDIDWSSPDITYHQADKYTHRWSFTWGCYNCFSGYYLIEGPITCPPDHEYNEQTFQCDYIEPPNPCKEIEGQKFDVWWDKTVHGDGGNSWCSSKGCAGVRDRTTDFCTDNDCISTFTYTSEQCTYNSDSSDNWNPNTGPDTNPDPTDPTNPDPTDPTNPDPTDPTNPDPTDPTNPDPTDPTNPDPTDPTNPDPTDPTNPDPTDPDGGGGDSSGGSGGGDTGGTTDPDPTPDPDGGGNGGDGSGGGGDSSANAGTCEAFTCNGEAVLCELLKLQHEQACAVVSFKETTDSIDAFIGEGKADKLYEGQVLDFANPDQRYMNAINLPGSCPAPVTVTVLDTSVSFSYDPLCDVATMLRPLIIAFGWFAALLIVGRGITAA